MNVKKIGFTGGSMCAHFAVFWLLWHGVTFEQGAQYSISKTEATLPTMKVALSSGKKRQDGEATATNLQNPLEETPIPAASQISSLAAVAKEADTSNESTFSPEVSSATDIAQDYFIIGRLTKLPTPVTEIDLDVPPIKGMAGTELVSLTILIEKTGLVTNVITSSETEEQREFSNRVAERFKNARFFPGEIDGKAVKSQLQIIVVSENLSADAN